MTNPFLTLESVSCVLPDGSTLFTDLHETFDSRHTGLVGRNGVGKTLLARMLAGDLQPSTGVIRRNASVHYLAQQTGLSPQATVADLAGVRTVLDALERIEAGSLAEADFDTLNDRWDMPQRLRTELERNGLGHLHAQTSVTTLSGGEAMRVALIGATLADAGFLILDEPTNHLDRSSRLALIEQLRSWSGGLLVISHDRQLLDTLERIVELSVLGLRSYGGNYSFYAQCKALEVDNARQTLERSKLERERERKRMQAQRERQERRQARGRVAGRHANQAKSLLDMQKERSESSSGKLDRQHAAMREQLDQRVREAARQAASEADIILQTPGNHAHAQRRVLLLDEVQLPFASPALRNISLMLSGRQRIGISGPNGCGKSTLLKVIAGELAPCAGERTLSGICAWFDQALSTLAPERSAIEQLCAANRLAGEDYLRTRLAQLGLDSRKATAPCADLSGGERLKAALACAIYADPAPALLLLDEPGNHLDLPSLAALESMLQQYPGALMVVSHDEVFLDSLALTHRLEATPAGWRLSEWESATGS